MLVVFEAMSRRGGAVVNDDVIYRFRARLFSLAQELGNVRAACRTMGVHPSPYYRWREPVLRSGRVDPVLAIRTLVRLEPLAAKLGLVR